MIWLAIEKQQNQESKRHAGGKAREDITSILLETGIASIDIVAPQIKRDNANTLKKTIYHFSVARIWRKALKTVVPGDTLILQFPVVNHTLFLGELIKKAKNKGVHVNAYIHDLETIRLSHLSKTSVLGKWRMKKEELEELHLFDKMVVHNSRMKEYLHNQFGLPEERMIVLDIFDYLIPNYTCREAQEEYQSCIVAGNLMKEKTGYIYQLPQSPDFELYGINYSPESEQSNIHYHGSFLADELPFHLKGGFGLVWDGDSIETCNGVWGNYLRYNNPHKTSLYLACGIPVIIWKEAALAQYILDHRAGFTVDSLDDMAEKMKDISPEDYQLMKKNAEQLSIGLRTGEHIKQTLGEMINQ